MPLKYLIWIYLWDFQGHDGKVLSVGCWVAVAYDDDFYIGQVLDKVLDLESEVLVDFLTKTNSKDFVYKMPKRKDTAKIHSKYIFCSHVRVQKVGTDYCVLSGQSVVDKYNNYKEQYMN